MPPRSRINLSAFLFSHHLVKTRYPLCGGGVLRRIRHDQLAFVFGIYQVLQRFGRVFGLDAGLVKNHADDHVAVSGPENRIDGVFRKILSDGRLILLEKIFLLHQSQRIVVGDDQIRRRPAGARFA